MGEKRREPERPPVTKLGRLTANEAAWLLGFKVDELAKIIDANLLEALGEPVQSAPKYYARCVIEQKARDAKWLNDAQRAVYRNSSGKYKKRLRKAQSATPV